MAGRDIPAGKGRARAVVDAVGVSRMVVVIYSADFNASEQAGIEVELASEDGKPVLVFRIADEDFPAPKGGYMQNLCIDAFPDPAGCCGGNGRGFCRCRRRGRLHGR